MSNDNQREVNSDKLLSAFATAALIIGVLVGVVLLIVSSTMNNTSDFDFPGKNGFDFLYLGLGVACVIQGVFIYALLKGFSDIVYLLKKMSGK